MFELLNIYLEQKPLQRIKFYLTLKIAQPGQVLVALFIFLRRAVKKNTTIPHGQYAVTIFSSGLQIIDLEK